ncbi:MAG: hypothetical protein IH591_20745, partial [Bacteroidales bacterium]|nr:hypothetical protein [Bacteroidales bacterium]
MNRNLLVTIALLTEVIIISSCVRDPKPKIDTSVPATISSYTEMPPDAGFGEFIASYTSGVIPANGIIEIRLSPEFAAKASKDKPSALFTFEPSIKGSAEWTDDYTIVFTPSKSLNPGTIYRGSFNLGRTGAVPERLKIFPFRIQTVKRDFRVSVTTLESEMPEGKTYSLKGEIITSDYMPAKEVEGFLTVKSGRKNMTIKWEHPEAGNNHIFMVSGIAREKEPQQLTVAWDGSKAGIREKASTTVTIPAAGVFSVTGMRYTPGETQRIDIFFSDPPDPQQELEGLIFTTPRRALTFERTGNMISIFPADRLQGEVTVTVDGTLRSSLGSSLETPTSNTFNFTTILPGLKPVGDGVIVPASSGLIFPFRAANIRTIDLTIIKIFSNNIPYFLQMNDVSGSSYIRQFGRPVYRGRVDLITGNSIDPNTWNLFTIDISDYIEVEPGVIYRVELGFRRSYSLYPCAGEVKESKYEEMLDRLSDGSWWESPGDYWDEGEESSLFYQYAYDWRERENPCSEAYYSPDRKLSRNLLATNLGLIAKRGSDNVLHIIVSDIATAEPIAEVNLEVYDLQIQLIGTTTSDKDGFASLPTGHKPFLLIASTAFDKNYLRLSDGNSLSLSSFDVAGATPEKGLKAFIYGERDVWRPGDSIYLSM